MCKRPGPIKWDQLLTKKKQSKQVRCLRHALTNKLQSCWLAGEDTEHLAIIKNPHWINNGDQPDQSVISDSVSLMVSLHGYFLVTLVTNRMDTQDPNQKENTGHIERKREDQHFVCLY